MLIEKKGGFTDIFLSYWEFYCIFAARIKTFTNNFK